VYHDASGPLIPLFTAVDSVSPFRVPATDVFVQPAIAPRPRAIDRSLPRRSARLRSANILADAFDERRRHIRYASMMPTDDGPRTVRRCRPKKKGVAGIRHAASRMPPCRADPTLQTTE